MRLDDNLTGLIALAMCMGFILLINLVLFVSEAGIGHILVFVVGFIVGVVATKLWDRHKKNKEL